MNRLRCPDCGLPTIEDNNEVPDPESLYCNVCYEKGATMPHAHTPYSIEKHGDHWEVYDDSVLVADTYDLEHARLIAAAPEMLDRLEAVCKQAETIMHHLHGLDHTDMHEELVKAYRTITRATKGA